MALSNDALRLMGELHRDGRFAYLWGTPGKRSLWWEVGEAPPDPPDGEDVYFGVHPTRHRGSAGDRGRTETVGVLNALYAEFDFKDFEGGEGPELVCRQHIDELNPPPSALVASGGGYHGYWIFENPWVLADDDQRALARNLQRAWVEHIGGDTGAKDLARVLRVPGTLNHKYDPPRPVELIHFNGARYSPKSLDKYLPTPVKPPEKSDPVETAEDTDEFARALMYVNSLATWRRDDYAAWTEVGIALRALGEFGLQVWDAWSRKSDKYQLGDCAKKWRTFKPGDGLTLESLKFWAHEDNPEGLFTIPGAPKHPLPNDYMKAMDEAGWEFRLNEADLSIQFNGMELSNEISSVIFCSLIQEGYASRLLARDCWTTLAYQDSFHPVMDYLSRLEWDGEDHIAKFATYFKDKHDMFNVWVRRFLVGAVARVAAFPRGQQNRMLVLDSKQGKGKSYAVRWLLTDVPGLHHEGPINPENKDDTIRLMGVWLWEVAELGSTFRKSDREALKFFITKERVKERKPYGREDTRAPAMASFVGTINNDAGFLSDPTGSRRYMVSSLTDIDWAYATEMEPKDIWAQAYALYQQGEPWDLLPDEAQIAAEINGDYEIENPIEDHLNSLFDIDSSQIDWEMPTTAIIGALKEKGVVSSSRNERSLAMEIGSVLRKAGCERRRRMDDGVRQRIWVGVSRKINS